MNPKNKIIFITMPKVLQYTFNNLASKRYDIYQTDMGTIKRFFCYNNLQLGGVIPHQY